MRDVGYTLEVALTDIVDNSISAGATTVQIFADTAHPSPKVAVDDDLSVLPESICL